jgi:hypothetical protein
MSNDINVILPIGSSIKAACGLGFRGSALAGSGRLLQGRRLLLGGRMNRSRPLSRQLGRGSICPRLRAISSRSFQPRGWRPEED